MGGLSEAELHASSPRLRRRPQLPLGHRFVTCLLPCSWLAWFPSPGEVLAARLIKPLPLGSLSAVSYHTLKVAQCKRYWPVAWGSCLVRVLRRSSLLAFGRRRLEEAGDSYYVMARGVLPFSGGFRRFFPRSDCPRCLVDVKPASWGRPHSQDTRRVWGSWATRARESFCNVGCAVQMACGGVTPPCDAATGGSVSTASRLGFGTAPLEYL